MATQSVEYQTLDKICRTLLATKGETTEHKKWLYLAHAKRFLDQLTIIKPRIAKQIKTVRLVVKPDCTVAYPEDYVDYSKIGVQVGSRVLNFAFNENLAQLPPDCCNPSLDLAGYNYNFGLIPLELFGYGALETSFPYLGYYMDGATVNIRGYGCGGYYGNFTKNDTCREFRFAPENNVRTIDPEYVSWDIKADKDTVIDLRCVGALEYFILWQIALAKEQVGLANSIEILYIQQFYLMHAASDEFGIAQLQGILDDTYSILPIA